MNWLMDRGLCEGCQQVNTELDLGPDSRSLSLSQVSRSVYVGLLSAPLFYFSSPVTDCNFPFPWSPVKTVSKEYHWVSPHCSPAEWTLFPLELEDTATQWSGERSVAHCSTPNPPSFSCLSLSHPRAGHGGSRRGGPLGLGTKATLASRHAGWPSDQYSKHLLGVYVA